MLGTTCHTRWDTVISITLDALVDFTLSDPWWRGASFSQNLMIVAQIQR